MHVSLKESINLKSINVGETKNSLIDMCFLITPLRHPSTNVYETNRFVLKQECTRFYVCNHLQTLLPKTIFHIVDLCCDHVPFRIV